MTGRSIEKLNTAMSEIEALKPKGSLSTIQLEVTDEKSVEAAAHHVQEKFGRLDVLINNAAVGVLKDDFKTRWQRSLETNVMGPALVTRSFRELLFKSKNPYSIYIGTGQRSLLRNATQKPGSHAHIQSTGEYQVSKAALNMLAVLEWRDYGSDGLKVFVVSPGFVRSNLRGTDEEAISGWGMAGDPEVSGKLVLDVVLGNRDADAGCLVHTDGIYPW
jgi:NAD(P)-dependent dehydrogenase (short-subunit alcohol dehydrogenase family)